MPETYSITIINASNSPQQFLLLQAIPKPSGIPRYDVSTNVYQRSPQVAGTDGSAVTFNISDEMHAIYGTSSRGEDGRARITTSSSNAGSEGSYHTLTTDEGGQPRWDMGASRGRTTYARGAFTIATDHRFQYPSRGDIYFGAGVKDPNSSKVIPVQTYSAKPSMVSHVVFNPKYYIAFGDYRPGTIIDMKELGPVLEVDFSRNETRKDASFTLNASRQYSADPSMGKDVKWNFGHVYE
ncbi:hypothetical protein QBC43DRAFT_354211 [Cladorrhinum sp. PSN259]|nr:hypothetical protein QBC43DRAFT_354211 [Cladorrhinum sp. PSN259]